MVRYDVLNLHVYPVITEMTATKHITTSHVCSTDESELKEFLVDETLSHICSMDKYKSKGIIVDECSTEEEKNQNAFTKYIGKQKTQIMRQSMRIFSYR